MRQDTFISDDGQLFTPEVKADIKSTQRTMVDLLIMLAAPTLISLYYYGLHAFYLILTSVFTSVILEYLGGKMLKNFPTPRDLSAVVTGICLALCLPAGAPLWLAALGASFAIIVAKLPFGNARTALFSPAAAGLCFLAVCFPEMFFSYPVVPDIGETVGIYGTASFAPGVSLANMLANSTSMGNHSTNYLTVLLGNVAGPMGATCIIALLGALCYLAIRRFKAFEVSASFLLTAGIFAFCFPRILTGRFQSVFMELSSGMLLFAAIFLLPQDILLPKRFYGRILYGVVAGLCTMLLRRFSSFEEGVIFVILLMNVLSPTFNRLPLTGFERKRLAKARQKRRALEEEKAHEQWFKESETEIAEETPAEPETLSEEVEQTTPSLEEQILNTEAAVSKPEEPEEKDEAEVSEEGKVSKETAEATEASENAEKTAASAKAETQTKADGEGGAQHG